MKRRHALLTVILAILILAVGILYTHKRTTYQSYNSNVDFSYPSAWNTIVCSKIDGYFLSLPGRFTAINGEEAQLIAFAGRDCNGGKVVFRISDYVQSEEPCTPKGERLQNGLYLSFLGEPSSQPSSIWITQDLCHTDTADIPLISFRLYNQKTNSTFLKFDRQKMLESRQYADIKKMAESIRINK